MVKKKSLARIFPYALVNFEKLSCQYNFQPNVVTKTYVTPVHFKG